MPRTDANGVNLHYLRQGTGSDVILLHGMATNVAYWLLTIVPRVARSHRATVYDLRGHGYSDVTPTGYTSGELAEDLRALMDNLGTERAHLVGHSYGGVVALHFAARYPERVRSLALADAPVPALRRHVCLATWPGYARCRALYREHGLDVPEDPDSLEIGELLNLLFELPSFGGMWRGLPVQKQRVERLQECTTCFRDVSVVGELTEERLRGVRAPTLVISNPDGPLLQLGRQLADLLPESRFLTADVSHFVPAVAPESLAGPLLEHFAASDKRSDRDETGPSELSGLRRNNG
jgi:pimeloyl-ACP methyl ester carboxylesterase